MDTVLEKFPGGTFLLAAGGKDRPDVLRPLASPLGASALSDLAVNDDSPDGLLGQVVGGSNQGIDQKAQVGAPMFVQTICDVLRFSRQAFPADEGFQISLNHRKSPLVLGLRHGVAQMPEIKEAFELTQEFFAKLLIGLIRKGH